MTTKKPASKRPEPKPVSPFRQWADRPDNAAMSELCQFIAEGGHLAGFCKSKSFAYVTVLTWIASDKTDGGRSEMYARAREDRADVLADEIVSIADEAETTTKTGEDGETMDVVFDSVAVQRNKLRVDARKWAASKLKPRSYGDKMAVTDGDGKPLAAMVPIFNITLTAEKE